MPYALWCFRFVLINEHKWKISVHCHWRHVTPLMMGALKLLNTPMKIGNHLHNKILQAIGLTLSTLSFLPSTSLLISINGGSRYSKPFCNIIAYCVSTFYLVVFSERYRSE